ncbi:PQ loop repeat-domain-containing protein [Gongronella butleri]|nr:PQ loop repeat-domain-containing protein [Gongronella butleri]
MTQCIPTKDGIPYTRWIYYIFGDCTYGTQDTASLLLGYFSILFWLNAQLPQVIENYRRGTAKGLSFNFLSIWLAGDVANLVGCVLTGQLPFQRYLGTYFVLVDITLVAQYIYYCHIKHVDTPPPTKPDQHEHDASSSSSSTASSSPFSSSLANSPSQSTVTSGKKVTSVLGLFFFMGYQVPRSTLSTQQDDLTSQSLDPVTIGFIFAWICTCLYLMSRVPQIAKNYRRQSVEGLAPSLFIFAVLGNLTYALGILIHPGQTRASLMDALPYLLGSAGTLMFDFTIFLQFVWYTRLKRQRERKRITVV